uniref:ATP-grasp domain-containing protein n=1 Tax=Emiliania huxleyi TaxID=2903 RepID=A0A7S3X0V6_EMIHU
MGDSRPLTCWSVDGVSVPSPPSLHQRRGLLRFLGAPARRIKAADDGASLSELNPDLGSLVKQRHPVLADAVKASMERAHHHSGHDGRTVSAGKRVLVFDVHVPLNGSQYGPMVHDGAAVPRGNILIGAVNEIPHAARRLGVWAEALVALPPHLMARSHAELSRPVAAGLLAVRRQYSRVVVCPARALSSSGPALARALRAATPEDDRRGRLYDGVLAWSGFHITRADDLAAALQLPPTRRYQLASGGGSSSDRAVERVHEGMKLRIRSRLRGSAGAVPSAGFRSLAQVSRWLNATRGRPVCFPCFLKPESHAGGSVGGGTYHIWKGAIHAPHQLLDKAQRLFSALRGAVLILERHLDGPMVFAETLTHRGAVLRASFRTLKMRDGQRRTTPGLLSYPAPHGSQIWQFPAVLTAEEETSCRAAVHDTVKGLGLVSGVFGLQLVLDSRLGCSLLEINLRPHGWPMLYESGWQALASDLWSYGEMALLLALDAPPHSLHAAAGLGAAPPPLVMDIACIGRIIGVGEMYYSELLEHLVGSGDCHMHVRRRGEPAELLAPPERPVPFGTFECLRNRFVAGPASKLRLEPAVAEPATCRDLCAAEAECAAFVHNRYLECHLLAGDARMLALSIDAPRHGTLGCKRAQLRLSGGKVAAIDSLVLDAPLTPSERGCFLSAADRYHAGYEQLFGPLLIQAGVTRCEVTSRGPSGRLEWLFLGDLGRPSAATALGDAAASELASRGAFLPAQSTSCT